jgi:hypothetical protein
MRVNKALTLALLAALGVVGGARAQDRFTVRFAQTSSIAPVQFERTLVFLNRTVTNTFSFDRVRCDGLSYGVSNRVWTAMTTALDGSKERAVGPILITHRAVLDAADADNLDAAITTNYFAAMHDLWRKRARAQLVTDVTGRARTTVVVRVRNPNP